MAVHFLLPLTLLLSILIASAQSDDSTFQISATALDQYWETGTSSFYGDDDATEDDDTIDGGAANRRSVLWKRAIHYYISYGALSANRIPCPPRSGRSYYTHNCYRARGPVHPYTRGCSAITRCRR